MTEQSSETTVADQVSVSRVVPHSVESVWGVLMKPHGAEALLGEGGELGTKGEPWRAADGTHGVARSFHPMEQIRFSWHPDDSADSPASVVELDLAKEGEDSTRLDLTHSQLPAGADHDALTARWEAALERIGQDAP
ncbi:SRPBCC family protein [Arsenicicoccus dermatophilus]|uniref:SRPBCC family protein n=1 Tax=Arsenicicoccus dermatophilus TaxID=1076331 RepID=UPI001F4CD977|nr:SRPBCC domain-containing protein [Arsenicicoccus dermatophilus]MCH8612738.1 SRPBCC domain-containing protein [Arsenicicoccus dermatophilus]